MPRKPRWAPTEKDIKNVGFLAGVGWSEERLAEFLGISKSTLTFTMKKNDALRQAILKGRCIVDANVTQSTYEMAMSKKHPAINIFWMKVRGRWKPPPNDHTVEHRGLLSEGAQGDTDKTKAVVEEFKGLLTEFLAIPKESDGNPK